MRYLISAESCQLNTETSPDFLSPPKDLNQRLVSTTIIIAQCSPFNKMLDQPVMLNNNDFTFPTDTSTSIKKSE